MSSCGLQSALNWMSPWPNHLVLEWDTKKPVSSWFAYHWRTQTPDTPIAVHRYIWTPSYLQHRYRAKGTPKNCNCFEKRRTTTWNVTSLITWDCRPPSNEFWESSSPLWWQIKATKLAASHHKVLELLMVHHEPTYSLVVLPTILFYMVLSPQIGLLILSLIICRSGPMPEPPMYEQDVMLP